jgi:hypothetical protein
LRQPEKIILHIFRSDAAEALDEFFKKTRFHNFGTINSKVIPREIEEAHCITFR